MITDNIFNAFVEALATAVASKLAQEAPKPTPQKEDKVLTIKEAAKNLRRSEKFIRDEIQRGKLKADNSNRGTTLRASWRVRESDIETYKNRQR